MKNCTLTILFTLVICVLKATTILVSSAADITNATPSPGDTLLMSATANWADQTIIADFDGEVDAPIVLLADGDGQVVLSGSSTVQIAGSYVTVSGISFIQCASTEGGDLVKFRTSTSNLATNCRITNCLFSDNNPTDLNIGYKWVSLYGTENRVDHCWFEKKDHRGTTVVVWLTETDDPNFHQIDHNYFTRPELTTGNNEAETIRIGDSQRSLVNSNTIVEYNYFEECDGEIESISNKSCYNVYRHNTFYNNHSILTLRHGHFCTVEGNYFFGNGVSGSGGVRIIGVGHKIIGNYMQDLRSSGNLRAPIVIMGGLQSVGINDATNRYVAAEDNIVAHNTIVNCDGYAIYIGSDKTKSEDDEVYKAPSNNTIENNIIYGSSGTVVDYEFDEIASFNYSGNIYNGISIGESTSNGFTDADPLFTFGTGLVPARITSNSPAIDQALPSVFSSSYFNYTPPTEDMDGQTRVATNDIGADEYSTTDIAREPIQKVQVGPCWMNDGACEGPIVEIEDCNNVLGGTASIDNCDVCSGGNTGIEINSSCSQDCAGNWDGDASIDDCNICSGGNTGIEINSCLQCEEPKATSYDTENDAVPANAFDGNPTTRWSANGIGEYIEFCLGDTVILTQISISYHNGDMRTSTFEVQTSLDGVTWTTALANQTTSGLTLDLEDYSISATAWKIRVIGQGNENSTWNSVTEIEWFGTITSVTPTVISQLNIYPNPVTESLNIEGLPENFSWEILNLQSKVIISGNDSFVNTSSLTKGIYLLKLSNGEVIKVHK